MAPPQYGFRTVEGSWPAKGGDSVVIRRILLPVVLVFWMGLSGPAGSVVQPGAASQFIRQLSDQAIATLSAPGGSLEGREAQFRSLLSQGFDLSFIGRFVLGRYWRQASPDQRADYLSEYVLQTYSARLGGYAGESMTIISERQAGTKDVVVSTRIDRPSGPPILADWRVRITDGRYRIIDIMVEGVSMVVTQRSEFAAVIQRRGLQGLIEVLRARTTKLPVTAAAN